MKNLRTEHLLFGFTLATLAALSAWWVVFFLRSVGLEEKAARADLAHAVVVTALMLGQEEEKPPLGPLPGPAPLEVVQVPETRSQKLLALALPRHPDRAVQPQPAALEEIERRVQRRRFMVIGEGGLLLALLAGLSFFLYRMVRREQQHLRRVERFVASVSHEMKSPLAGMKSLLQTFAAGRVPEPERERLCALGLKEAERLEHTIENLLVSGRLDRGEMEVQLEQLALKPFLEAFIEHRRRYLLDRPESLLLHWEAPEPLLVAADAQALRTVLENLVDNAFKYGGTPPEVRLRVRASEWVEICVEDNGGFDPSRVEEMFRPFQRLYQEQCAARHGTGLGLSISRELARQMGGELSAKSSGPGQGSCFMLSIRPYR